MEPNTKSENNLESQKKKYIGLLIGVSAVLVIILGYLIYIYFDQKSKMVEMEIVLTAESDSLTVELTGLLYQYDTLKTNNDSLQFEMGIQQDKIKKLLSINTSSAQKIRLYKKELSTLREVMKSYIKQIDSLNTRNIRLIAENKEVKSQLNKTQKSNIELTKIKKELTSKVQLASVLQAKDLLVSTLNSKGKQKSRITKIDVIKVCFILRENPVVSAGNKEIFIRLIRPDDVVLATSADNLFEVKTEENKDTGQLVYSASRIVEYLNQDIEVCLFYKKDAMLIPGTYTVFLYAEGYEIGTSTFLLN